MRLLHIITSQIARSQGRQRRQPLKHADGKLGKVVVVQIPFVDRKSRRQYYRLLCLNLFWTNGPFHMYNATCSGVQLHSLSTLE